MSKIEISRESLNKLIEASIVLSNLRTKIENPENPILADLEFIAQSIDGLINDQVVQHQLEEEQIIDFFINRTSRFKNIREEYNFKSYWNSEEPLDLNDVCSNGFLKAITLNGRTFNFTCSHFMRWSTLWHQIDCLIREHIDSSIIYIDDVQEKEEGHFEVRISYL